MLVIIVIIMGIVGFQLLRSNITARYNFFNKIQEFSSFLFSSKKETDTTTLSFHICAKWSLIVFQNQLFEVLESFPVVSFLSHLHNCLPEILSF